MKLYYQLRAWLLQLALLVLLVRGRSPEEEGPVAIAEEGSMEYVRKACREICEEARESVAREWGSICASENLHLQRKRVGGSCRSGVVAATEETACFRTCLCSLGGDSGVDLLKTLIPPPSRGAAEACDFQNRQHPFPEMGKACAKGFKEGQKLLKERVLRGVSDIAAAAPSVDYSRTIQLSPDFSQLLREADDLIAEEERRRLREEESAPIQLSEREKRRLRKLTPRGMACNACRAG